jgi:5-methylcytosine-specific restriction endonuclease McrA
MKNPIQELIELSESPEWIAQKEKQKALLAKLAEFRKNEPVKNRYQLSKSQEFYQSREWRELRYKTLVKSGRKCLLCQATNVELHCDHIKPISRFWNLRLAPDNVQVLCKDCNLGKSNKHFDDFRENNLD